MGYEIDSYLDLNEIRSQISIIIFIIISYLFNPIFKDLFVRIFGFIH